MFFVWVMLGATFAQATPNVSAKSKVWVLNGEDVEGTTFDAERIAIEDSYFISDASLVLGQASIDNWTQRINYPFQVRAGSNVVLHLQTRYFSRWQNLNPLYTMQLNLEIPSALFKSRTDVSLKNLQGFLAWAHPNLLDGKEFYLEPVSGHLEIWKVKKGFLRGRVNLKFKYDDQTIHVYGKIRSPFQSRESYVSSQETLRQELYDEAQNLGNNF